MCRDTRSLFKTGLSDQGSTGYRHREVEGGLWKKYKWDLSHKGVSSYLHGKVLLYQSKSLFSKTKSVVYIGYLSNGIVLQRSLHLTVFTTWSIKTNKSWGYVDFCITKPWSYPSLQLLPVMGFDLVQREETYRLIVNRGDCYWLPINWSLNRTPFGDHSVGGTCRSPFGYWRKSCGPRIRFGSFSCKVVVVSDTRVSSFPPRPSSSESESQWVLVTRGCHPKRRVSVGSTPGKEVVTTPNLPRRGQRTLSSSS